MALMVDEESRSLTLGGRRLMRARNPAAHLG
eukprot:CAMPEP_0119326506 /NCGR_PEP_ID=MMETSP1333-20130426/68587_1 /TAXON_ID=418940 /ORGANISM="Scyphosphaera apsteinii, Strain RCC1455" /LENGTH=30 /DNA_ID= /DNA_START= /DNA_END= /DNA_ORIENTATION=